MKRVGEGRESTISTKDFKPTLDLLMTSARSNSIYCDGARAYQGFRLAGPCILFNAHNFFYMHINKGLPSEEGKGFLSNEIKSKQGWNSTHRVCWVALFSGSKKMRVSVSSPCNTGKHDAVAGKICRFIGLPKPGQICIATCVHHSTVAGWN